MQWVIYNSTYNTYYCDFSSDGFYCKPLRFCWNILVFDTKQEAENYVNCGVLRIEKHQMKFLEVTGELSEGLLMAMLAKKKY